MRETIVGMDGEFSAPEEIQFIFNSTKELLNFRLKILGLPVIEVNIKIKILACLFIQYFHLGLGVAFFERETQTWVCG